MEESPSPPPPPTAKAPPASLGQPPPAKAPPASLGPPPPRGELGITTPSTSMQVQPPTGPPPPAGAPPAGVAPNDWYKDACDKIRNQTHELPDHTSSSQEPPAQEKESLRRERCVKELLEVETRYQADMEKICRFVNPLRAASSPDVATLLLVEESTLTSVGRNVCNFFAHQLKAYTTGMPEPPAPILYTEDVKALFANIQQLQIISQSFLSDLRPAVEAWSESATIGKIFTDFAPLFKAYCDYARVRDVTQLGYLRNRSVEFVNFEVWHKGKNNWFTLESELIKPMQHTIHVVNILRDLVKHTAASHPDYAQLTKGLKDMEDSAHVIDAVINASSADSAMLKIQQVFGNTIWPNTTVRIIQSDRQYIGYSEVLGHSNSAPL